MPAEQPSQAPWAPILQAGREDGRLVGESLSERGEAKLVPPPRDLHPQLLAAIQRLRIEQLYSHQAEAVAAAFQGPIIVTTGTASGKSLCFNLPTIHVLLSDPRARALYLYPTKALAQDQARALASLRLHKEVRPAIYDGDTPKEARAEIRRKANVILTNPDMLHVGILPNHQAWAELFANLAVVVIDEAHVYRGVFGSHVGNVLRRLRRIANAYRTSPRFMLSSATIANPVELGQRLTGLQDIKLIDEDGSPTPQRQVAMWNPPIIDEELGSRGSAIGEGAQLLASLVSKDARVICFVRSRKGVELLVRLARQRLEAVSPQLAEQVVPYRAGYTAQQRRELEDRLMKGDVRAVVSTDALELGIDIGELDASLVITFPGTVSSLKQMWGRAGRRGSGLAVYVAGEDALDQFFCKHQDEFLSRPVETAILDHESLQIHLSHLLCAAYEGPLVRGDAELLGPRWEAYAEMLVSAGQLRKRGAGTWDRDDDGGGGGGEGGRDGGGGGEGGRDGGGGGEGGRDEGGGGEGARDGGGGGRGGGHGGHGGRRGDGGGSDRGGGRGDRLQPVSYVLRRPGSYPAGEISLRSASPDSFAIVDLTSGELLGSVEAARAHTTVHQGAIYLHLGVAYEVIELDVHRKRAFISPFDGDWYTQPKVETDLHIERLLDRKDALSVRLSLGEVCVKETVSAYQRKRVSDHAQIDLLTLDLPETSFNTQAVWFELDDRALCRTRADGAAIVADGAAIVADGAAIVADGPRLAALEIPLEALLGALHATEHSQIAVLPLIAMCDRWDIGGLSTNLHPQTGKPTIFIYDGHPGGVGIARTAFARFEELCSDALRLISSCKCSYGCPSCVQSPKCGNLNEPLSKAGAALLLRRLLEGRPACGPA